MTALVAVSVALTPVIVIVPDDELLSELVALDADITIVSEPPLTELTVDDPLPLA